MRQLSYAEQMRPARGRGWIVVVHWGLVQLGRHGQARCALRLRPRAATTVRPEQFRPWVHTWNVLRPRARVLLWSLSGATGQLSGASACRRALGPRRLAGAAGKGRCVLPGLGCLAQIGAGLDPPPRQPGSPSRSVIPTEARARWGEGIRSGCTRAVRAWGSGCTLASHVPRWSCTVSRWGFTVPRWGCTDPCRNRHARRTWYQRFVRVLCRGDV